MKRLLSGPQQRLCRSTEHPVSLTALSSRVNNRLSLARTPSFVRAASCIVSYPAVAFSRRRTRNETSASYTFPSPAFSTSVESSPTSSSSSMDEVWRQTTQRILNQEIGTMNASMMGEAHHGILYWLAQNTVDGVVTPLQILDRLVHEELAGMTLDDDSSASCSMPDFYDANLLNLILNHWRKVVAEDSAIRREDEVHPRKLVHRVMDYHQNQESKLRPNTQTFAMIVDGASTFSDGAQVADELVRWIIQEAPSCPQIQPNVYTISSLMNAWVKSKDSRAASKVEEWLDQMHDLHVEFPEWGITPNQVTYATAIDAWAKNGRVDRVEELLQDMHESYKEMGMEDLKPNLQAFNGLLVALARAGQMDRAEEVLAQMEDLHAAGELDEAPSVISYSTVLNAFAKSRERGAAARAEAILRKMNERGVEANVISWNTVIDAYGKEKNAERAENLLHEMMSDKHGLKPSMWTYAAVLSAWSAKKTRESGERAEQLLEFMKTLRKAGELEDIDVVVYNSVLACWARSKFKGAALKAKDFLENIMIGEDNVKPDAYSYNTVMSALVQEGQFQEAEAMLSSMQENGVAPDITAYNTLLSAWIKSGSREAPERVTDLYNRMRNESNVEADLITMNTLLNFYSKTGNPERAESLLEEMCSPDSNVQPDSISFNTVIAAWTASNRTEAPEQAEAVLSRMIEFSGGVRPNVITFNSLLNAWVKNRPSEALPACKRLVGMMFDLVAEGNNHVQPDAITYTTLIRAHCDCGDDESLLQGEIIFKEMHRRYDDGDYRLKPTFHTYLALIYGMSRSGHPQAGDKAEEALRFWLERADQGKVDVRPRINAFAAVMKSHLQNSGALAAFRIDIILHLLLKELENGNQEAKPDSRIFNLVLRALAESPVADKVTPARNIVNLMKQHKVWPDRLKVEFLQKCVSQDTASDTDATRNHDRGTVVD